jgi:hypothetical protein
MAIRWIFGMKVTNIQIYLSMKNAAVLAERRRFSMPGLPSGEYDEQ